MLIQGNADWRGIPEEYRNQIVTGDARELSKRIPDESVDLIFTDPPYKGEYLYLYEWLGECAKRILKPTGFLLSYVAPYHKNKIFGYFDKHLEYFWDYIEYNKGNSTIIWPRRTISRYKSILAYRIDGGMPATNVLGVYPGRSGKYGDKRYHKWGQTEDTVRYFIEVFLGREPGPGTIVFDPFAGGGTTAAVCKQHNINWISFEIEADDADIARDRIENTIPPLFILHPEQLDLML